MSYHWPGKVADVYASMICSTRSTRRIVSLLSLSSSAVVEGSRRWHLRAIAEGQATEARQHEHNNLNPDDVAPLVLPTAGALQLEAQRLGPQGPPCSAEGIACTQTPAHTRTLR